ncbi:AAA family ATPase [Achromobacter sp. Marseille-Q0513]|uniref:AAA family ATPase n=1 Tax=Achromobacter sp. Marseille-Q0513 TaxID=2829161 RepID=UPI001B99EC28|nr:AAA family ATPase [Achromobacter sp. Marseille-Q0513]MBR8654311.1 AAA family ATPase [Achromobacter sp. Marseille-Q0513]
MSQIISPADVDFEAYMAETEPQAKVLAAEAWRDELARAVEHGEQVTGAKLPWAKTHDLLRFRPGEVTLWQGINGHGKSELLGQACIGFACQDERVCIASFEMKPQSTLKRMLRQTAMNSRPSVQAVDRLIDWSRDRLWLYDQQGTVKPAMLYAVARYCADRLKVRHLVIDSLMKCVRCEDDYNGQKDFVDMLCTLARDLGMHIHLVHHAKKGENEDAVPGKFSAKGSGAIVDQVDQMLTVWRNKKKERIAEVELRNGGELSDETLKLPDTMLICDKNRHGEWEGRISLWRHADSLQFTSDQRRQPIDMIGALA